MIAQTDGNDGLELLRTSLFFRSFIKSRMIFVTNTKKLLSTDMFDQMLREIVTILETCSTRIKFTHPCVPSSVSFEIV